ncbi:MAG: serine protease [Acidobacteria bacterium]|nr:serine protease [Acidobacteriota bacterium]
MPPRPRPLAVALFAVVLAGCNRDDAHLDDVQKMAYSVKPAVVRISAYATAEFHYDPAAIAALTEKSQDDLVARNPPAGDTAVTTGAGGSGSGFVVHPDGFILTSGHVVAPTRDEMLLRRDLLRNGAISALVKHFPLDDLRRLYREDGLEPYISTLSTRGRLEKIEVVNEVELSNGEKLPFVVRRYSPALAQHGTDVALLKVEHRNLPVLQLGDSDASRVGESIWSVGYPAVASSTDDVIGGWLSRDSDLEATFNPGIITALKRNRDNVPVFQSNVAIYRGNSGGPTVNRAGLVVGISTWGHTDAEQIKFLVPINVAKGLLASTRVTPNVDGEFNRHYRSALDAAVDGDWSLARRQLASANQLFPNSPDLIRFGADIDRAVRTMPMWRQHPLASAFAAVVLSLALLFCLKLALTSRRPRFPKELLNATTETVVAPGGRDAQDRPLGGLAPRILGKFTILNGSRAGERLGLGGSGIRIGRESMICEIVLENPKVSRLHAEVVSIDGKVLLIDRNSSNGTYVNDQKIDKRFLKDGDIIYFGGRNAVAVAFHA